MSSLQRYKKSGGFFQLLSLIETFAPAKKEKFLEMIEAESPAWAGALREKMISVERIFTWPDQTVIEVFKRMQPKNLAYALQGLPPEQKDRVLAFFSASEKRRMEDTLSEGQPKPHEIATTLMKVVDVARKMLLDRELYPDKFDPALTIPEDIELRLEGQTSAYQATATAAVSQVMGGKKGSKAAQMAAAHEAAAARAEAPPLDISVVPANATGSSAGAAAGEVVQLQKTLGIMVKENKWLKDEVRTLREKLDQIKKLSA